MADYITRSEYIRNYRFTNNTRWCNYYDRATHSIVFYDKRDKAIFARKFIPERIYKNPAKNPNLKPWKGR